MYDVGIDERVKLRAIVSIYRCCARLPCAVVNILVLLYRNVETSRIERYERVNKNVSRDTRYNIELLNIILSPYALHAYKFLYNSSN